jgi:hypothetical protein
MMNRDGGCRWLLAGCLFWLSKQPQTASNSLPYFSHRGENIALFLLSEFLLNVSD